MIVEAVRSQAWIFDALGELIAATPSLPRRPQREDVLRGIEAAFRLAAARKISIDHGNWTRHLGLERGTVLTWRQGRTLPSLWLLLVDDVVFALERTQAVEQVRADALRAGRQIQVQDLPQHRHPGSA